VDRARLIRLAQATRELRLRQDRRRCEESLSEFLRGAWRYIDPSPYVHGWHLDAIAEHLQAVTDGDIRRLIINVPPRTSKSSLVSVAWPAWVWAQPAEDDLPLGGAKVQFLFASYAQSLSMRDSVKMRRLIMSPWYRERWGRRFSLTGDQNAKVRFDNDRGGYRLSTSVGGSLTGEGAAVIVVDDPNNAIEAESDAVRQSTVDWWDNALSTRLNDPKTGAYVIIMQRLHEEDLTGHILTANHEDWTHLMLPMRYEADRCCSTGIGWADPREVEGELLCPERFGDAEVRSLERVLGPYQFAGQMQQRPEPKGGGIFKREWWQEWAEKTFPACNYIIASLDPAYTEKQENDYSGLTVWGAFADKNRNPKVILMAAWRDRLAVHDLVLKVAKSCNRFKVDRLLVEAKASGISVMQELRRLFGSEPWSVEGVDPKRLDKTARAYSVQPLFSDGMIYAPDREWADMVIDEMATFPRASHDDLVDSATQALRHLRMNGIIQRAEEVSAEITDAMTHKGRPPMPLYGAV